MNLRLPALLCCAALGLGVAACGDDDDSASGAAATTAAPMETPATMPEETAAAEDIVALASRTPELSTLVRAVGAAGLVETLQGEGPFTVFAPTNDAFAAVDRRALAALLQPSGRRALTGVLTYHVVPARAMAADLRDGQVLETVQGERLTVSIDGDTVKVGGATVTMPEVAASNGVVHVIDTVLMPPSAG
ncbi:MAG TPA: fasciclin domain-containing protein [Conexibacter sp.]|nr:fasciclin domain-containing protein [Conexibacter sp.]